MRVKVIPIIILFLALTSTGLAQAPAGGLADYGKPAPKWLREAGMFNGWYSFWTDDGFERVKGMPLIVTTTHSREVVNRLHASGVHVAFYVNQYVFYNASAMEREYRKRVSEGGDTEAIFAPLASSPFYQVMDLTKHRDWIWMGPEGYPRKQLAIYEEVYNGNEVALRGCVNSVGYREAALAAIKELMDMGIDGLFLDCTEDSGHLKCWGPELGKHQHVHPEWDGQQAWLDLQKSIYALVKSYGEDRVVLLNSSSKLEYLQYADAYMLESYILTHVSTRRWHDWKQVQEMRKVSEPAVKAGKVVLALSYAGYTPNSIDEDAFYAYACARLFGYCWADWFTLADTRSTLLYRLKLGASRSEVLESNGILYKLFEKGVVVVNPNYEDRELKVKMGFTFLREVLTNRRYAPHDESKGATLDTQELQAVIPAQSGRVFISGFSL